MKSSSSYNGILTESIQLGEMYKTYYYITIPFEIRGIEETGYSGIDGEAVRGLVIHSFKEQYKTEVGAVKLFPVNSLTRIHGEVTLTS